MPDPVPDPLPVPPFTRRIPRDVADRIQATATLGPPRRRMAVLVLGAALFGGLSAAAVPSGEAQAMRKDCPNVVVVDISGVPHTVESNNC